MKTHIRALTLIAVLGGGSVATAADPREDVHFASSLTADYASNGMAADKKYRKRVTTTVGVVEEIRSGVGGNPYITLAGHKPLEQVRCELDAQSVDAALELKKGQLIGVSGTVTGQTMMIVGVAACKIRWAGAQTKNAGLVLARSSELCVMEMIRPVAEKAVAEFVAEKLKEDPSLDAKTIASAEIKRMMSTKEMKQAIQMTNEARKELQALGEAPLACGGPSQAAVLLCDGAEENIPECQHALLRTAVSKLKH